MVGIIESVAKREAEDLWVDEVILQNYARVKKTAYYIARRHGVPSPEQWAEDMAQEVFLRMSRPEKLRELREHPNITGWLMKTLTNVIGSEWQKNSNREIAVAEVWSSGREPGYEVVTAEELFPPELSAQERDILYRCKCQELSHEEVAASLGISAEACRKRLQRAEEKFRAVSRDSTKFDGFRQSRGGTLGSGGAKNV